MLENISRKLTYIRANQYGQKTAVTIDGKEYCENEICVDGEYTTYPESLEDQLQRLVPNVGVNLISEFLSYVENTNTPEGFSNAQKMWNDIVCAQESISNTDNFKELGRFIAETRGTLSQKGGGICDIFTTKVDCQKCPFNNGRECRLSSALASLKALQDACEVKGDKK